MLTLKLLPSQYQDLLDIFGDGTDYDWAYNAQTVDEVEFGREDEDFEFDAARKKVSKISLEDVFEPGEVREKFMTERDEAIRITDVPERMQLAGITAVDDMEEILRESIWVATYMTNHRGLGEVMHESHPLVQQVQIVIRYLRQDLLEVPFIISNRKDYWQSHFAESDIWFIHDADEKYRSFTTKREVLLSRFDKLDISDDYFQQLASQAESVEEVADLTDYLNFSHATKIKELLSLSGDLKRNIKIETWDTMRRGNIPQLISDIGLSGRTLFEDYKSENKRFADEMKQQDLMETARAYLFSEYMSPESLLNQVQDYLAHDISNDPQIRRMLRKLYETEALISVVPTEKGKSFIDITHPYYPFKYISMKPIYRFNDGQILQILKAVDEGLVTLKVGIYDVGSNLIRTLSELIYSEIERDDVVKMGWNNFRVNAVKKAIGILNTMMEKFIIEKLRSEAEIRIAQAAGSKLMAYINVAPYRTSTSSNGDSDADLARVMSISVHGEGRSATVAAVMLDANGNIIDHTIDNTEYDHVSKFLSTYNPDVIVFAAYHNVFLKRSYENLLKVSGDVPILWLHDEVARIYQFSSRAEKELPDFHSLIRYSVSLGRRLQNPLFEFATLFNPQKEVLMLNLHPLQSLVSNELLLRYLERSMINMVTITGVDINDAARHQHHSYVLQFVSGLGPRKVYGTLKKVNKYGTLESRSALITNNIIAKTVFINCASFIRIRKRDSEYGKGEDYYYDVLDDTRIHPEDYDFARKLAQDALDVEEEDDEEEVPNPSRYVEELMEKEITDRLDDLLLDDYAQHTESSTGQKKRITLEIIKNEIKNPYGEKRDSWRGYTQEYIFELLTGETDETLRMDQIIAGVVTQVRDKFVRVRLESGLEGLVQFRELYDQDPMMQMTQPITHPSQIVRESQPIKCRILNIDKSRFTVDLTCRKSQIESIPPDSLRRPHVDEYFDTNAEQTDQRATAAPSASAGLNGSSTTANPRLNIISQINKLDTRIQNNPLFRPFNTRQCLKYLSNRPDGDVVIRPSSLGENHITVTWRITPEIFQHLDVIVSPLTTPGLPYLNSSSNSTTQLQFTLNNRSYMDLDELIHTYVTPTHARFNQAKTHRKSKFNQSKSTVSAQLIQMLKSNPNQIAYSLIPSKEYPGYLEILFVNKKDRPVKEVFVKVGPEGYRFMDVMYGTLDECLNAFKRWMLSKIGR
ncbi:SH2 domain-containing protein [Paraphysoderma sedebokerense]|nr:SH2 domain-containing protein [Paraphysoderma sedebokerense]